MAEKQFFLLGLAKTVVFIDIKEAVTVCRDPKDDKFLELAINGNAKIIISGDQDLLVLHPFNNISILTVKDFLELE